MITGYAILKWNTFEVQTVDLMGNVRGMVKVNDDGEITRPHLYDIVFGSGTMTNAEARELTSWVRDIIKLHRGDGL